MAYDPLLALPQGRLGLRSIAGEHVEGDLDVEDSLREILEREQADRLPVQLCHPILAVPADRLVDGDRGAKYFGALREQRQNSRNRHCGRIGGNREIALPGMAWLGLRCA